MNDEDYFSRAFSYYLLRRYDDAIKNLQKVETSSQELKSKCDLLLQRVHIGQGNFTTVLQSIPENSLDPRLKIVRLLAQILSGVNKEAVYQNLDKLLNQNLNLTPDKLSDVSCLTATIYGSMGDFSLALKVLNMGTGAMCEAMTVQCMLSMNRFDLAYNLVDKMLSTYEDDELSVQLATAMAYTAASGNKLKMALDIYHEMEEKFGPCALIINGQAVAYLGMEQWDEAEACLNRARMLDPDDVDIVLNLMCISQHNASKARDNIHMYLDVIKRIDPKHPFLNALNQKSSEFDECSKLYIRNAS